MLTINLGSRMINAATAPPSSGCPAQPAFPVRRGAALRRPAAARRGIVGASCSVGGRIPEAVADFEYGSGVVAGVEAAEACAVGAAATGEDPQAEGR
jgi:hypothetical protein